MKSSRSRVRQAALMLSAAAGAWALIVALTGGFFMRLGPVRISSRSVANPGIAALVAAAAAWLLATRDERRRAIPAARAYLMEANGLRRWLRQPPRQLATGIVLIASVTVVVFGLRTGGFVAGGADAYGYVSQADLWARGSLIVRQPFAREMTWPNAAWTVTPLGYRPYRAAPHGTDIVPSYSPGVPLLMAAFKLVAGAKAVYWVVPLLGGLAVWAVFVMGRRLSGPLIGASAAVLLASSPSFLFELTAPASDVAATAWWTLAFTCLTFDLRSASFASGLFAGFAILTRPNLVPLAAIAGALPLWRGFRAESKGTGVKDVLAFAAGAVPAAIAVAVINWGLYGSPLASGYGGLNQIYQPSHVWPNLGRYPLWLVQTQTPVVLLALAAPFVLPAEAAGNGERWPRATSIAWLCAIASVFSLYLFWVPFDTWWYLRFILPVFPPLFVLTVAAMMGLLLRAPGIGPAVRGWTVAIVVSALAWHGITYATDRGVAAASRGDQRYVEAGRWIAANLPERAVLLSMQHSGAARYYSGRITIRYDLIAPADLDRVAADLRRLGYRPYILLDDWEEEIFRDRFAGHSRRGTLDWLPVTAVHSGAVRIYEMP